MDQTSIGYSLYIPRVALSSSSSSSKSSSRFKESSVLERPPATTGDISETSGESESEGIYGSSGKSYDGLRSNRHRMYYVHKAKRGSHSINSSSSSSLTSNNSANSANSLLLSVKNLENFNKSTSKIAPNIYENQFVFEHNYDDKKRMLSNIRSILAIENVTKDTDVISTVSSMTNTNFTVVTFNDCSRKAPKAKAICRRSHQVTILILVMSFLFLVGISGLVCMLEMRYQKMPR